MQIAKLYHDLRRALEPGARYKMFLAYLRRVLLMRAVSFHPACPGGMPLEPMKPCH